VLLDVSGGAQAGLGVLRSLFPDLSTQWEDPKGASLTSHCVLSFALKPACRTLDLGSCYLRV
jgi:hypothetical protein